MFKFNIVLKSTSGFLTIPSGVLSWSIQHTAGGNGFALDGQSFIAGTILRGGTYPSRGLRTPMVITVPNFNTVIVFYDTLS